MMKKNELLKLIFVTFLKISLFVVGGGLAMIPVIEDVFVRRYKLLKNEDILNMITMSQTVPGLIAINSAIFVGNRLAGICGSLCAVAGILIPSFFIIVFIAAFFPLLDIQNTHILMAFSCVRASILGVFVHISIKMVQHKIKTYFDIIIALFAFFLLLYGVPVIWLILASIPVGCLYILHQHKKMEDF